MHEQGKSKDASEWSKDFTISQMYEVRVTMSI
jgi:hypothetical protein